MPAGRRREVFGILLIIAHGLNPDLDEADDNGSPLGPITGDAQSNYHSRSTAVQAFFRSFAGVSRGDRKPSLSREMVWSMRE